jgi:4a-hydroxytetrahydrobiopterin dehydratase
MGEFYLMTKENDKLHLLSQMEFIPYKEGTQPLKWDKLKEFHTALDNGWIVIAKRYLEKEYKFENFKQALDFTNQVGELAEELNHHPTINLSWGKVKITLWTHEADGLTEGDFIFAAKVDTLFEG